MGLCPFGAGSTCRFRQPAARQDEAPVKRTFGTDNSLGQIFETNPATKLQTYSWGGPVQHTGTGWPESHAQGGKDTPVAFPGRDRRTHAVKAGIGVPQSWLMGSAG